jgi:glycosyltransferase involved in cell wall biosynthesis
MAPDHGGRLRVLIVTNLFPNNADPTYAPFNRQQFSELGGLCDIDVFGVVPWRFGTQFTSGSSSNVVREEQIDGLPVLHPRFPAIPGLSSLNAGLLTAALVPEIAWRMRKKRFDVMLAAYAYPDGCAGVVLSQIFGVPVVVKCHGSDLNRVPQDGPARFQIQKLVPRADEVVVVSKKLKERAIDLGVPAAKIHVVYNGVDRARFRVVDRAEARRKLRLPIEQRIVVCVGHLADHKGTKDLLEAALKLRSLQPTATVAFVGDGPLSSLVQDRAEHALGAGGVLAVGRVPHEEVADWIAASDVLCLPSWDEGMPNVVREAHASGRPVVATAVGGVPEAIDSMELGRLVPPRSPEQLAQALDDVLRAEPIPAEVIVEKSIVPTWRQSAEALYAVLEKASRSRR